MTCLRPSRRNTLPATFRRREMERMKRAAERALARHKRDQVVRGLPRFLEFPIDPLHVN